MVLRACTIKKLWGERIEKSEDIEKKRLMMWNDSEDGINGAAGGTIAVAVEKGVASQSALKWAIDHLVPRSTNNASIKLVHVINTFNSRSNPSVSGSSAANDGPAKDAPNLEFFLPLRCYCTRKRVQFEVVILEDQDVAQTLIEYISGHGIESIALGAISRTGFSRRLFKAYESIPSKVLKLAPHFCSVYTIKQGKMHEFREASRPVPIIPAADAESNQLGIAANNYLPYDEFTVPENEISFVSSGRPSTDSMIDSFYQNFGYAVNQDFSVSLNLAELQADFKTLDFETPPELSSSMSQHGAGSPLVSQRVLDDMEDEMKRLRVELKQTMDMYHSACKEAVAAKQKATELEEWKAKEGQRLEEARLAMAEEKENHKAIVSEADEAASQRFVEQINAEQIMAAIREAEDEEKRKVFDALGQSHKDIVTKYQSLVHILVVLCLFSLYLSLF